MNHKTMGIFLSLLVLIVSATTLSQTKCIWFDKVEHGVRTQKFGIAVDVVKLLAHPGSSFDINGVSMTYDSLLTIYENDLTVKVKNSTDDSEITIHTGKFYDKMNEQTDRHDYLISESTEGGNKTKVTKLKVKSIEAMAVLFALVGSKDIDNAVDAIESALQRGGIFCLNDFSKDSQLWIYVN